MPNRSLRGHGDVTQVIDLTQVIDMVVICVAHRLVGFIRGR
jgi:hypothetical protein